MKYPKCGKRTSTVLAVCKHFGKRLPQRKKGLRPKPFLSSWIFQSRLLIAGVIGILILIIFFIVIFSMQEKRKELSRLDQEIRVERSKEGREIASNAVLGRIIAFRLRTNRRGTMAVRSLQTGKEFTFFIGWRTSYHPRRYPTIGEQVKVYYLLDKNLMEATQVVIGE
jgi:hypothetical protein